ncbi:ADP-ribosylglycohydrolase family protein [Streptomyces sp. FT05W]|uniref:ADP-ribosylation/Crystallin J1 n=1 Tax=Streptomyces pratensis (strain ATCC 33331 / IAF-45CD) TaxID=591167 RepID=A0A8D3WDU8_STRFA|nr:MULTISPECIES: ADP-ribosylglycohydrolase family protein [Streptomyces]RAS27490.1 ADP-ribosylglycohydrolase [Streptomyces avidinii]TPN07745.1 ADP-ribosylglycohydrolase family protein [Mesorhizobium sp. B2-3-3]SNX80383.1 ADP-ribosylglycohydrolase [Streptomyces microflavus]AGJ57747.1 putative hydrolase [Streptomyces sp. PAMC 26508]MCX4412544.1 ADP-ribosylglycohydrolase family protein [[Kitasatospora] papulosa]
MTADSAYDRFERALASLRGLSVGDALGSQFFVPANYPLLKNRALPPGDWQWTDDTEMASSVLSVLAAHERVDQDALAHSFARHHDFDRGYGPAVNRLLRLVREGGDWRELASALFQGQGSWGNGSAMRIAPLGAWYADDPEQATHQAEVSSYTTHQHREAVVGAMAVAAAAALVAAPGRPPTPEGLIDGVVALIPRSAVGAGLRRARDMLDYRDAGTVAAVLGNGRRTSAHDTVPFALWSAARSLGDFEQAFWVTAQAGGDVDTTCAIVGGIVAAEPVGAPPAEWLARTEELPDWLPSAPARR